MTRRSVLLSLFAVVVFALVGVPRGNVLQAAQAVQQPPAYDVKANYVKTEFQVPMRDGVKLFTCVYAPKDASRTYPIMLNRTPYSVAPYGPDAYKPSLGPSDVMMKDGYIFVYQDVRGRMMSEGNFVNMTPHIPKEKKAGTSSIDESSDTYDAIEWLVKNVPNNNGRVGMWGISYPGFYTAAGMIDAHPALKASSPQAPIADWFIGDDMHHNGAFFLFDSFAFFSSFGLPRPTPTTNPGRRFDYGTPDAYRFFLEMGAIANANPKHLKNEVAFWNEMTEHPNYDEFWKARNILPHLKNVPPAVMTVGGWFDAEDLYGPLHIYHETEKNNPKSFNILVMGPWIHGGWARTDGSQLGAVKFGSTTAAFYRENIEAKFFGHFLKDQSDMKLPEAYIFNTGANEWRTYDHWPPVGVEPKTLFFHADGKLSFEPPMGPERTFDEYVSDPAHPVPYTNQITNQRGTTYMIEDQRFAAMRPDVLTYQTDVLNEDLTIAGPISAELFASTTGTDADFVVKLIDVFPNDTPDTLPNPRNDRLGGYQMLVRGEVMRGRFRNSYEKPEPMPADKPAKVMVPLQDAHHTFKKGHRIMIQVQSSWFPLVDRNPQKFVDIYKAKDTDFQTATHRVYHSKSLASQVTVQVMK